ncbi:MAG: hypothetical protein ABIG64_09010 [Candidatus Omnitrophota bacterium]
MRKLKLKNKLEREFYKKLPSFTEAREFYRKKEYEKLLAYEWVSYVKWLEKHIKGGENTK